MKSKVIIVYHSNCADGFTSAWIMKKWFWETYDKGLYELEFVKGSYGAEYDANDFKGANVFLVDFSFQKEFMEEVITVAAQVTIYDHHKTAEEYISPMIASGKVKGVFDMKRSGALITWNECFPDVQPPTLVEYVSDSDLWEFKLPNSKDVSMYIFAHEYTFDNWDKLAGEFDDEDYMESSVFPISKFIQKKHKKDIAELVEALVEEVIIPKISPTITFFVVNLPYTMASDSAGYLAEHYAKDVKIGFAYARSKDGSYTFSIRANDDTDVSKIAQIWGGGGHRAASGFKVDELPFIKVVKGDEDDTK